MEQKNKQKEKESILELQNQISKWNKKQKVLDVKKLIFRDIKGNDIQRNEEFLKISSQRFYQKITTMNTQYTVFVTDKQQITIYPHKKQIPMKTFQIKDYIKQSVIQPQNYVEIISISQLNHNPFLFVIFDNKFLYLFCIITQQNELKIIKTPFRIELRCAVFSMIWNQHRVYMQCQNEIQCFDLSGLSEMKEEKLQQQPNECLQYIKYSTMIKTENEDVLTTYDVSDDNLFFTIIHNRVHIFNQENKVLYVFKPNNKNNENFIDIKVCNSTDEKTKFVLSYSDKNIIYLHECNMSTGAQKFIELLDLKQRFDLPNLERRYLEYQDFYFSKDQDYLVTYNKAFCHLIIIQFDKQQQKFGTEVILKLPKNTLHVTYQMFSKDEMIQYFDKKYQKTNYKSFILIFVMTKSCQKYYMVPVDFFIQVQKQKHSTNQDKLQNNLHKQQSLQVDHGVQQIQDIKKPHTSTEINKETHVIDEEQQKEDDKQNKMNFDQMKIDYLKSQQKQKFSEPPVNNMSQQQKDLYQQNIILQSQQNQNIDLKKNQQEIIDQNLKLIQARLQEFLNQQQSEITDCLEKVYQNQQENFLKNFEESFKNFMKALKQKFNNEIVSFNNQLINPLIDKALQTVFEKYCISLEHTYQNCVKRQEKNSYFNDKIKEHFENFFEDHITATKSLQQSIQKFTELNEQFYEEKQKNNYMIQKLNTGVTAMKNDQYQIKQKLSGLKQQLQKLIRKTQNLDEPSISMQKQIQNTPEAFPVDFSFQKNNSQHQDDQYTQK